MNDSLKNLVAMARNIAECAEELQRHPEGAKAFEAWCEDFDFNDAFGTRWKDVGDEMAQLMILNGSSFGTFDKDCGEPRFVGKLYIESFYSTYVWWDGEWKLEDDLVDELEENTEKV